MTLRVSFLTRDHKLRGFLLSTEPEAEYRLECTGCTPTGIVTIVQNPLGDLDPTHRGLYIYQNNQTHLVVKNGEMLLLRVGTNNATRGVDLEGYPRAEVIVTTDQ